MHISLSSAVETIWLPMWRGVLSFIWILQLLICKLEAMQKMWEIQNSFIFLVLLQFFLCLWSVCANITITLFPEMTWENIFNDEFWVARQLERISSVSCTSGCAESHALLQTCFSAQKKVKTTLNLRAAEGELTEEKHNLGVYTPLYTKTPVLLVETDITQEIKTIWVLPDVLSSYSFIVFAYKRHKQARIKREVLGFLKSINWGLWRKWSFPNTL